MVLFITGLCSRSCFYCPVSEHRRGKDVIYANEREVQSDIDLLYEARSMDALGTGITGGEPLMKLDRTLYYIELLKKTFGPAHHIHLYTSRAPSARILGQLAQAGLDEIRFHPPIETWDHFDQSPYYTALRKADALGLCAGVEIPSIKRIPAILKVLAECNAFLNLNELEFSETNCEALKARGFVPVESNYGAVGSQEIARELLSITTRAYFCPSTSKDGIQLRERLKRKARRLARPFDETTEDGTLVYAVIAPFSSVRLLRGIPGELYTLEDGTLQTSWQIALELVQKHPTLSTKATIVETYPDGMLVESTPVEHCVKPKT